MPSDTRSSETRRCSGECVHADSRRTLGMNLALVRADGNCYRRSGQSRYVSHARPASGVERLGSTAPRHQKGRHFTGYGRKRGGSRDPSPPVRRGRSRRGPRGEPAGQYQRQRSATTSSKTFSASARTSTSTAPADIEYAKAVIFGAFGPETGKRMVERLVKSIGTSMAGIEALQKADPEHMAKIIHREHPQTIALVLCHLSTPSSRAPSGRASRRAPRAGNPPHGHARADLSGSDRQAGQVHLRQTADRRRIQSGILRRRARGRGSIEPCGFERQ